jgi:hypothetical protein
MTPARSDPETPTALPEAPETFDQRAPNVARVYDWLLGGCFR